MTESKKPFEDPAGATDHLNPDGSLKQKPVDRVAQQKRFEQSQFDKAQETPVAPPGQPPVSEKVEKPTKPYWDI
jgi:hypothetical protein